MWVWLGHGVGRLRSVGVLYREMSVGGVEGRRWMVVGLIDCISFHSIMTIRFKCKSAPFLPR